MQAFDYFSFMAGRVTELFGTATKKKTTGPLIRIIDDALESSFFCLPDFQISLRTKKMVAMVHDLLEEATLSTAAW